MYSRPIYKLLVTLSLFSISCNSSDPSGSKGPIVLGDSSMIVTETDPEYLGDLVDDYNPIVKQPVIQNAAAEETSAPTPAEQTSTPENQTAETTTPENPGAEKTAVEAPTGEGLRVDFNEIAVFIPNINTTSFSHSARNKNNAAFMLTEGTLGGNKLEFSGTGKVTRVIQRYRTVLAIESKSGTLVLPALAQTSNWETLDLKNNTASLSKLQPEKLQYLKVNQNRIRTEVTKVTRANKMNRNDQQDYLNAVKNVKAANKKPMLVKMEYVIWQISGHDAKGRSFSKELRIDLPK